MNRRLLLCSILGFTAVALGAMGAHGLKAMLAGADDAASRLALWDTAAKYHLAHALAVGLSAFISRRSASVAALLWAAGTVLFSGSLYALALSGAHAWGRVTPFGGVLLLAGWVALAFSARK